MHFTSCEKRNFRTIQNKKFSIWRLTSTLKYRAEALDSFPASCLFNYILCEATRRSRLSQRIRVKSFYSFHVLVMQSEALRRITSFPDLLCDRGTNTRCFRITDDIMWLTFLSCRYSTTVFMVSVLLWHLVKWWTNFFKAISVYTPPKHMGHYSLQYYTEVKWSASRSDRFVSETIKSDTYWTECQPLPEIGKFLSCPAPNLATIGLLTNEFHKIYI